MSCLERRAAVVELLDADAVVVAVEGEHLCLESLPDQIHAVDAHAAG
jgi:hypothetical protein